MLLAGNQSWCFVYENEFSTHTTAQRTHSYTKRQRLQIETNQKTKTIAIYIVTTKTIVFRGLKIVHSIEALKSGFGFCRCTNEETFINKRRAKRNNIELILCFGMKIAQIGGKQRRELVDPECSDEVTRERSATKCAPFSQQPLKEES